MSKSLLLSQEMTFVTNLSRLQYLKLPFFSYKWRPVECLTLEATSMNLLKKFQMIGNVLCVSYL